MKIHIEELKFQTIIGILDFEREEEQEVILNLLIEYNFDDIFINYADVVQLLTRQMQQKQFFLIEDALESLSKDLKEYFPQIQTLDLKITKPTILPNCNVSVSNFYSFNS